MNELETFLFDLSGGEERKMNSRIKHKDTRCNTSFIDIPIESYAQCRDFLLEYVLWDDYDGDGCIVTTHKFKIVLNGAKNPVHINTPIHDRSYLPILESYHYFGNNVYMCEMYPLHSNQVREI